MDFFLEIILGLYMGLAEALFPNHEFKKWQSNLLKVLSFTVTLGILVCLAAGIDILTEHGKTVAGITCTAVGCSLFAVQTVLFIVVAVRQMKGNKRKKNRRKISTEQSPAIEQSEQPDNQSKNQ